MVTHIPVPFSFNKIVLKFVEVCILKLNSRLIYKGAVIKILNC